MTTKEDAMDLFAGQAMQAILSNPQLLEAVTKTGSQDLDDEEAMAAISKKAYDLAAVMLVERGARRRAGAEFSLKPPEPIV
jgi:hypothetical protein